MVNDLLIFLINFW